MKVSHGVILASAGSGKTYRLANRILALLARGAKPGEIVALTFTRKAAAEFVSRVLMNLARAAANDGAAAKLAGALNLHDDKATREFFQKLLEDTVAESHRLRFGTMDGFFQSLVRSHPLELGLAGGFTLLDERRATRERRKILRGLLRAPAAADDAKEFMEAFRLASFGREARGAADLLERFAQESLQLYRESGDAAIWGAKDAVWPEGTPWFPAPDENTRRRDAEALVAAVDQFESGHKGLDKSLRGFAEKALLHRPGATVEFGAFADKHLLTLKALAPVIRGEPLAFDYQKKERVLPPAITVRLAPVLRGIIAGELETRLHRTAGAGRLIAEYAERYDAEVIGAGLLGFSDITHTLAKPEYAAVLEQAAYRLDGAVNHWLFDEFQDTSRRTWSILAACAGEVLAHNEGERSAFFVGDVKQAIYAWNGGDHRLLPELREKHALPTKDLTETQRCGPEVTALVNAVCGALADAPGMPAPAAGDWRTAWHAHTCGEKAAGNTGYARWVIVDKPKRDGAEDPAEARMSVVIDRIHEADFLGRGLSVGVLTRTNAEATGAAELLRHAGIACVCETDVAAVRDNPATLTLLAAVRHAAHPGDTLARETVAMSPLAPTLGTPLARHRLLTDFTAEGAEAALRRIVTESAGVIPTDAFTRGRIATLLAIAREYDATGERDASAFAEFAAATMRRDTASAGRVQVMTLHKSKGLEFDVVFLPFLEGAPVDSVDSGGFEALRDRRDGPVRAILSTPTATVCEADAVLGENLDERRATAAYEQLCALYVALTRAKHELTLVSHAPPEKTAEDRAPGWTGLLAHAFELDDSTPSGEVYAWGEPDWYAGMEAERAVATDTEVEPVKPFPARVIPRAVTPSGAKGDLSSETTTETAPGDLIGRGKEFGTEVHRIFEHLERLAPGESPDAALTRLRAVCADTALDKTLFESALTQVASALKSPDFQKAFALPADATVRNELSFSILRAEDELLTGTFDRVVVTDDTATIYDFKTDACEPESLIARYGEPMRIYRTALAKLMGIAESNIRLVLLHTPTGRAIEV
jgi:ATP-dependent helicase/nuclease subunit A